MHAWLLGTSVFYGTATDSIVYSTPSTRSVVLVANSMRMGSIAFIHDGECIFCPATCCLDKATKESWAPEKKHYINPSIMV